MTALLLDIFVVDFYASRKLEASIFLSSLYFLYFGDCSGVGNKEKHLTFYIHAQQRYLSRVKPSRARFRVEFGLRNFKTNKKLAHVLSHPIFNCFTNIYAVHDWGRKEGLSHVNSSISEMQNCSKTFMEKIFTEILPNPQVIRSSFRSQMHVCKIFQVSGNLA